MGNLGELIEGDIFCKMFANVGSNGLDLLMSRLDRQRFNGNHHGSGWAMTQQSLEHSDRTSSPRLEEAKLLPWVVCSEA